MRAAVRVLTLAWFAPCARPGAAAGRPIREGGCWPVAAVDRLGEMGTRSSLHQGSTRAGWCRRQSRHQAMKSTDSRRRSRHHPTPSHLRPPARPVPQSRRCSYQPTLGRRCQGRGATQDRPHWLQRTLPNQGPVSRGSQPRRRSIAPLRWQQTQAEHAWFGCEGERRWGAHARALRRNAPCVAAVVVLWVVGAVNATVSRPMLHPPPLRTLCRGQCHWERSCAADARH